MVNSSAIWGGANCTTSDKVYKVPSSLQILFLMFKAGSSRINLEYALGCSPHMIAGSDHTWTWWRGGGFWSLKQTARANWDNYTVEGGAIWYLQFWVETGSTIFALVTTSKASRISLKTTGTVCSHARQTADCRRRKTGHHCPTALRHLYLGPMQPCSIWHQTDGPCSRWH